MCNLFHIKLHRPPQETEPEWRADPWEPTPPVIDGPVCVCVAGADRDFHSESFILNKCSAEKEARRAAVTGGGREASRRWGINGMRALQFCEVAARRIVGAKQAGGRRGTQREEGLRMLRLEQGYSTKM